MPAQQKARHDGADEITGASAPFHISRNLSCSDARPREYLSPVRLTATFPDAEMVGRGPDLQVYSPRNLSLQDNGPATGRYGGRRGTLRSAAGRIILISPRRTAGCTIHVSHKEFACDTVRS